MELGDLVAFLTAKNTLLGIIVGAAGLGRSWSLYFASMINSNKSNFLRIRVNSLLDGFNLLDPTAVVVFLVAHTIAMTWIKRTS